MMNMKTGKYKKILCLIAVLCLAFTGCGKGTSDSAIVDENAVNATDDAVSANETAGKEGENSENADDINADADYTMAPGTYGYPVEGGFQSGKMVIFDSVAYLAEADGVYRITADNDDGELIIPIKLVGEPKICTDGFMLYLASTDGAVYSYDLENGASEKEIFSKGTLPDESSVVGVGRDRIYVQAPESFNTYGDYSGLSYVLVLDMNTGEIIEELPGHVGGSYCGYTYTLETGYDSAALGMTIYGFDGTPVIQEDHVYAVYGSGDKLWYATCPDNGDGVQNEIVIYSFDIDEPEEIYRSKLEGEDYYFAFTVGGFFARIASMREDGDVQEYLDLRTGEFIPYEELYMGSSEASYWFDGVILSGDKWSEPTEIYIGYSQIAAKRGDGLKSILELPADFYGDIYVTDGHIVVDDYYGSFTLIPIDESAVSDYTAAISMTSEVSTLFGSEGGMDVSVEYTEFGKENDIIWSELMEALNSYNENTETLAKERLDAALELHNNEEIRNELGDRTAEANIKAYIKRADTTAFSFTQHQYFKLGHNGYGLEDIRTGYNFDTKDGHELALTEVVTDIDAFGELFIKYLMDNNGLEREAAEVYVDEYLELQNKPSCPEMSWVLGYEGVTFYYNGDVNFPYAMDCGYFYVPFSEHPEIFNEIYFDRPKSYTYDIMLDAYYSEEICLDTSDGIYVLSAFPNIAEDSAFATDRLNYCIYESSSPENWLDKSLWINSDTLSGMILHEWNEEGGTDYLILQTDGDAYEVLIYEIETVKKELEDVVYVPLTVLPQYYRHENKYGEYYAYVAHPWLHTPELFMALEQANDYPEDGYTLKRYYRFSNGELIEK